MPESKAKKRRVVKKPATVREEAAKTKIPAKPRRIHSTVSRAKGPFYSVFRLIKKILSPFSFLLIPFKTRPARFIGRILAKVLAVNYVRASWNELKQVAWPNARETFKLTIAVFVFAIAFSLMIAALDYGLDKVFKALILN